MKRMNIIDLFSIFSLTNSFSLLDIAESASTTQTRNNNQPAMISVGFGYCVLDLDVGHAKN